MLSVKELIRQARVNGLQDVDAADPKFNDKALIDALNDTIQTALKLKPILRWTDTHTYKEAKDFAVSSAGDTVAFPEEYESALVNGICAEVCKRVRADEPMARMFQVFEQAFLTEMRI